jgi:hypothetical protein
MSSSANSPAARAGLTIYVARRPLATSLTADGVRPRRASSRTQHRNVKTPTEMNSVGCLVDSFAPAHSPATLAGLTVHVARCPAAPFWLRHKQKPVEINPTGFLFWRRPTLARPVAVLPSGLQRFTAVFGMGTGGATALLSPECGAARAFRCCRSDASARPILWRRRAIESIAPT